MVTNETSPCEDRSIIEGVHIESAKLCSRCCTWRYIKIARTRASKLTVRNLFGFSNPDVIQSYPFGNDENLQELFENSWITSWFL